MIANVKGFVVSSLPEVRKEKTEKTDKFGKIA
jgi:hypothetical protein